ncbi:MAG: RidA family protein [Hyphomonadaceae bacterium]
MTTLMRRRSIPAVAVAWCGSVDGRPNEPMKPYRPLNPAALPEPVGNYTHGTLVQGAQQLLFVSGQVAWGDSTGKVPSDFDAQCLAVWGNIETVLREGGMQLNDLVKVTTFLASREHRAAYGRIREQVLGAHAPALTIVICEIYAPEWLLEIEAIAAR